MYQKVTKYRIKELINKLPATDRDVAMKNLPNYLNVTRQTFSKILNVSPDDPYEPASGTLIKIAVFLNVPVEDLLCEKPSPFSISDLRILSAGSVAKDLLLSK